MYHCEGVIERVEECEYAPSNPKQRAINPGGKLVIINAADELDAFVTVTIWIKERQDA